MTVTVTVTVNILALIKEEFKNGNCKLASSVFRPKESSA